MRSPSILVPKNTLFTTVTLEYVSGSVLFGLGLWFLACAPMRAGGIPGNLGDARFNIYLLEHVFRWVTGRDPSLWTAPFFVAYPYTFAFSSNHLGSFPFYLFCRVLGLGREGAFLGWYLLGFFANFAAAGYVLLRMKFSRLAASAGAFIFTFGLPMLAQTGHAQLLYRTGVPLACYRLLCFYDDRRIWSLAQMFAFLVWQMTIEIYTGVFLSLLLFAIAAVKAVRAHGLHLSVLFDGPLLVAEAWKSASPRSRCGALIVVGLALMVLLGLLWPYVHVTHLYGLKREWTDIEPMIPRLQSYALCSISDIWHFTSIMFVRVPMVQEQQMFVGAVPLILLFIASLWKRSLHRSAAITYLAATLLLFIVTIHLGPQSRYTPYRLLAELPGLSALRAVSRIILVMLWPVGVLAATALDEMWHSRAWMWRVFVCVLVLALFVECCSTSQSWFSKSEATQRLTALRTRLSGNVAGTPILVAREGDPPFLVDLDAMLLAQDLGWSTLNGYSGNLPPAWPGLTGCSVLPGLIARSLAFSDHLTPANYNDFAHRLVPVGFDDCRTESLEPSFSNNTYIH